MSKRYSVSVLRERLSDALDEAERGGAVIIERRGVRYRLTREPSAPKRRARRTSRIETLDPAVAAGEWSWDSKASGLAFRPRPRRRA